MRDAENTGNPGDYEGHHFVDRADVGMIELRVGSRLAQ
jgi:hypothetical protein